MRAARTHIASPVLAADRLRVGPPKATPTHPITYQRTRWLRETCLGPTSLERDTHQRLRTLMAEHPGSVDPGVDLVIDTGTPHRLVSGGHRARHEQIPSCSRRIAFHFDVAVQAVMDREGEDCRRSPKETSDCLAPFEPAQRRAFPNRVF